jgi:hypothetical protein
MARKRNQQDDNRKHNADAIMFVARLCRGIAAMSVQLQGIANRCKRSSRGWVFLTYSLVRLQNA